MGENTQMEYFTQQLQANIPEWSEDIAHFIT